MQLSQFVVNTSIAPSSIRCANTRWAYPGVAEDFAETFRKQKTWDVDVWVSAHGSQYGLHDKYEAGQDYSPETFVDPEGFLAAVERLEKLYLEQIAAERR